MLKITLHDMQNKCVLIETLESKSEEKIKVAQVNEMYFYQIRVIKYSSATSLLMTAQYYVI